jgi:1-acyl-sn-glycerol-3-phosphate acyltransferase
MSTIRGWIYYIVLAITLIPLAIALIILYPASVFLRYQLAVSWARFMLKMGEIICGMRYQFKGTENFPTDGTSVLVLSKHQSAWDIFALASLIPHQASFVYKKELHYVPVFGHVGRLTEVKNHAFLLESFEPMSNS